MTEAEATENKPRFFEVSVRDVKCGKNVKIVKPSNLYECTLEDNVFVGPFVEIQRGVVIGAGTRVQSHAFVCTGVTTGQECFLSHGVVFVNDRCRGGVPHFDPA